MTSSDKQKEQCRQFLLGNLPEQQAQALEERIFLEPDLAEDLQIEEEELIAEYHSGTLPAVARELFEKKYRSTEANKRLLEYEAVFREFVRSKPPSPQAEQPLSDDTDRILSVETESIQPVTGTTLVGAVSKWLRSFLGSRQALAYSTALVCFILISVALWYLILSRSDPTHSAQRREAEAALAMLNSSGRVTADGFGDGVELKPIQRFSGEIVRVGSESVTADGLIQFRLSLTEEGVAQYSATFLDEKHTELFTISNIAVRATPRGPQVWVVVPIQYLSRGDYQIELSDAASNRNASNSYPFRLTLQK